MKKELMLYVLFGVLGCGIAQAAISASHVRKDGGPLPLCEPSKKCCSLTGPVHCGGS